MAGTETDVFGDLIIFDKSGGNNHKFNLVDDEFYTNLKTFLKDTSKVPIDDSVGKLFKYVLRPLILSLLYFNENRELINLVYGFLNYNLQYNTGIDAIKFLLDLKRFVRIIILTSGGTLGPEGYVTKFISGISSKERGDDYFTKYFAEISLTTHSEADYREFPIARMVDTVSHYLTNTRVQSSSNLLYSKFKTFEKFFLKTRIKSEVAQFMEKKTEALTDREFSDLVKQIADADSLALKRYIPTLNRLKDEEKLSEDEYRIILDILRGPARAQGGGAKKSKRKRRASSRRPTKRVNKRVNKRTNKRKGRHNKKRTNKKN